MEYQLQCAMFLFSLSLFLVLSVPDHWRSHASYTPKYVESKSRKESNSHAYCRYWVWKSNTDPYITKTRSKSIPKMKLHPKPSILSIFQSRRPISMHKPLSLQIQTTTRTTNIIHIYTYTHTWRRNRSGKQQNNVFPSHQKLHT